MALSRSNQRNALKQAAEREQTQASVVVSPPAETGQVVTLRNVDPATDRRTLEVNQLVEAQSSSLEALDGILGATERLGPDDRDTIRHNVSQIHSAYNAAKDLMMKIGVSLLKIYKTDPELYEKITHSPGILPFSHSQAVKYRKIAELVANNLWKTEELPSSMRVAYEASKLDEAHRETARSLGYVGPEVTIKQINEVKKIVSHQQVLSSTHKELLEGSPTYKKLVMRKARLEVRLEELESETLDTRAEICDLEDEIATLVAIKKANRGGMAIIEHGADGEDIDVPVTSDFSHQSPDREGSSHFTREVELEADRDA